MIYLFQAVVVLMRDNPHFFLQLGCPPPQHKGCTFLNWLCDLSIERMTLWRPKHFPIAAFLPLAIFLEGTKIACMFFKIDLFIFAVTLVDLLPLQLRMNEIHLF
jgi:hypothetical protein